MTRHAHGSHDLRATRKQAKHLAADMRQRDMDILVIGVLENNKPFALGAEHIDCVLKRILDALKIVAIGVIVVPSTRVAGMLLDC